jgi:hypothetical protein
MARRNNQKEIAELLEAAGAKTAEELK